jgi:Domain of Unknown Function (DUF1080).
MSKFYVKGYVLPVFVAVCICTLFPAFSPAQVKRDNTLTPEEKQQGWILLFDGKTTNGWRSYNRKPQDSWEVLAGQLHCKIRGVTNRADLMTVAQYDNYELKFDWKIEKGANSGVLYRVIETSQPAYETGPEYQLIDDEGYPEKLEDWQKSGSDYAMHPPMVLASKPAGEYNHSKIVVKGAHVQHWLNSRKVADFYLWTPEWKELKAKSKWKDAVNYGMAKKGFIVLQDHGGGVWFKNIKLRKL